MKDFLFIFIRIAVFSLICVLVFTFVLKFTRMSDNDMYPALQDGDLMIGYRLDKNYDRGDLIQFERNGSLSVRRIIGLPGDVINIDRSGNLFVNGTNSGLNDLYPTYPGNDISYPYRVPDDNVFVLGDYRIKCEDSRDYGPVKIEDIKAKAIAVLRQRDL